MHFSQRYQEKFLLLSGFCADVHIRTMGGDQNSDLQNVWCSGNTKKSKRDH